MQLPAFPLEAVSGTEPQPQRWEAGVLSGPLHGIKCEIVNHLLLIGSLSTVVFQQKNNT